MARNASPNAPGMLRVSRARMLSRGAVGSPERAPCTRTSAGGGAPLGSAEARDVTRSTAANIWRARDQVLALLVRGGEDGVRFDATLPALAARSPRRLQTSP